MNVQLLHKNNHQQTKSTSAPEQDENFAVERPTEAQTVMQLQRLVGNQAVQRLLAQGKIQRKAMGLPMISGISKSQPQVIHRCTCGRCNGIHREEEISDSKPTEATVQRFWGGDDDDDNDAGGGVMDWISDTASNVADTVGGWFGGGDNDKPAANLPKVEATCQTEEGIGYGSGEGQEISLHGKTDANYNHGKPIPEPFPEGVTVTTGKVGKTDVFSTEGSFDVEFLADTKVTLPSVPGGLTECQTEAVKKFIDGPLTDHENDHVSAFKDNYDGTFTVDMTLKNIPDTSANRKAAMDNPVSREDEKRIKAANAASKKLDPWNKEIEGLDCEAEQEEEESTE